MLKPPKVAAVADDSDRFLMDAVRVDVLGGVRADLRLPYVLSMPWACPGHCSGSYALLVNTSQVLDVEIGQLGERHLSHLAEAILALCSMGRHPDHLRTDGSAVWEPVQSKI